MFPLVRAIVAPVALVAIGVSSSAQRSAETAVGGVHAPVISRALKDYVPVLRSTLDRVWAVDPKQGVEPREVADGVFVVTDEVWQSAFAVNACVGMTESGSTPTG